LELRCGRLSLGLQVAPLITERDIFLSLTMKPSMAVNGCRRVVGVIGKVEQPCQRYRALPPPHLAVALPAARALLALRMNQRARQCMLTRRAATRGLPAHPFNLWQGHVKGVMRALSENHSGKFKELTWTPARAAAKEKVFGVVPKLLFDRLVVDSIILIALVKAWEFFHGA